MHRLILSASFRLADRAASHDHLVTVAVDIRLHSRVNTLFHIVFGLCHAFAGTECALGNGRMLRLFFGIQLGLSRRSFHVVLACNFHKVSGESSSLLMTIVDGAHVSVVCVTLLVLLERRANIDRSQARKLTANLLLLLLLGELLIYWDRKHGAGYHRVYHERLTTLTHGTRLADSNASLSLVVLAHSSLRRTALLVAGRQLASGLICSSEMPINSLFIAPLHIIFRIFQNMLL